MNYRAAAPADAETVARLLEEYMQETYQEPWHGTVHQLERDGFGAHFALTLAVMGKEVVGFVAWRPTYDLHHCLSGIDVIDMFVRPGVRGRGVAPCLLARVAAEGLQTGATFMTGGAVETGSGARLYGKAAISHGSQAYLSGRAFRAFAQLSGVCPKDLLRGLPPREWNLQP